MTNLIARVQALVVYAVIGMAMFANTLGAVHQLYPLY
jgi:hypothetical protein